MRKKNGGSNVHDVPFEFNAGDIMAVDHVGAPFPHRCYSAPDPQIADAPGRCALRQSDGWPFWRLVDFMTQRNVVTILA